MNENETNRGQLLISILLDIFRNRHCKPHYFLKNRNDTNNYTADDA